MIGKEHDKIRRRSARGLETGADIGQAQTDDLRPNPTARISSVLLRDEHGTWVHVWPSAINEGRMFSAHLKPHAEISYMRERETYSYGIGVRGMRTEEFFLRICDSRERIK